jgi:hypothetical protein
MSRTFALFAVDGCVKVRPLDAAEASAAISGNFLRPWERIVVRNIELASIVKKK